MVRSGSTGSTSIHAPVPMAAGSIGDFGNGVDVGVGVEAVVGRLHRHVGYRALQLASSHLAELLQAWRSVVGEETHGFEPAEPGVHERVGLVSFGVAQPAPVRGVVGVS